MSHWDIPLKYPIEIRPEKYLLLGKINHRLEFPAEIMAWRRRHGIAHFHLLLRRLLVVALPRVMAGRRRRDIPFRVSAPVLVAFRQGGARTAVGGAGVVPGRAGGVGRIRGGRLTGTIQATGGGVGAANLLRTFTSGCSLQRLVMVGVLFYGRRVVHVWLIRSPFECIVISAWPTTTSMMFFELVILVFPFRELFPHLLLFRVGLLLVRRDLIEGPLGFDRSFVRGWTGFARRVRLDRIDKPEKQKNPTVLPTFWQTNSFSLSFSHIILLIFQIIQGSLWIIDFLETERNKKICS